MSNLLVDGNVDKLFILTSTLNVASVAANTTAEQTFTINGLRVGDMVFANKPALNAGLGVCNARVSAANTLALTFNNNTAGAIDPGAEAYTVMVMRPKATLAAVP